MTVAPLEPSVTRSFGARQLDLAEVLDVRTRRPVPVAAVAHRVGRVDLGGGRAFIVAEGALLRRLVLGPRAVGELLGPGDVIVAEPSDASTFTLETRALTRLSLAQVDLRSPALGDAVLAPALLAALDRARHAPAAQHLVLQVGRLEDRMAHVLPPLAERWGVMTADGVVLPAFFSHRVWADLLGVRRPSFTTVAARLAADGTMTRLSDGRWLLGAPA